MKTFYYALYLIICLLFNGLNQGYAQSQSEQTVSGIVLDASGLPVSGVRISEAGTDNGIISGEDGKFSLTIRENAILVLSQQDFSSSITKGGKEISLVVFSSEDGIKNRYWCCTSHKNPKHCSKSIAMLLNSHGPEERYERSN